MANVATTVELFGTRACPFTAEARDDLEWRRVAFTEYDVDLDPDARHRLLALTGGNAFVPVLVEDGRIAEIGWRGHGCFIESGAGEGGSCGP
jgi:mycoredoxin